MFVKAEKMVSNFHLKRSKVKKIGYQKLPENAAYVTPVYLQLAS